MIDTCLEKIMASSQKQFNVCSHTLDSLRIVRVCVSLRRSLWRETSVLGKNTNLNSNQLERRASFLGKVPCWLTLRNRPCVMYKAVLIRVKLQTIRSVSPDRSSLNLSNLGRISKETIYLSVHPMPIPAALDFVCCTRQCSTKILIGGVSRFKPTLRCQSPNFILGRPKRLSKSWNDRYSAQDTVSLKISIKSRFCLLTQGKRSSSSCYSLAKFSNPSNTKSSTIGFRCS